MTDSKSSSDLSWLNMDLKHYAIFVNSGIIVSRSDQSLYISGIKVLLVSFVFWNCLPNACKDKCTSDLYKFLHKM